MKAAIVEGNGKVKLGGDIPVPEPGPYQCLCKMLACATCTGTDRKIIDSHIRLDYPAILGHESVGRVIKIGAKVRNIKEREMFLRPTACYPGGKIGNYYSGWGGFAEFGLITDTKALLEDHPQEIPNHYTIYQQRIPQEISISPADATMLITLKEVSSFIANLKVTLNSSVAILGCGAVGISMCYFAKIFGAYPVIVIGRRDKPLENAKKAGADFTINNQKENMVSKVKEITADKGVNYIIDAAGDIDLITESEQFLSLNGKIAPYAVAGSSQYIFDRNKAPRLSEFIFTDPRENTAHQYILDAIRLNFVNPKLFYSHRMPLEKIEEGFELLRKKEALKIVFEMED